MEVKELERMKDGELVGCYGPLDTKSCFWCFIFIVTSPPSVSNCEYYLFVQDVCYYFQNNCEICKIHKDTI